MKAIEPIGPHNLSTSEGGRGYLAEFFAKRLRRHDFYRYINERLAADFACALSQYLLELETPDCNGSHDYGAIAAGEKECTACTGEAPSDAAQAPQKPYGYVLGGNYWTADKLTAQQVATRTGGKFVPVYAAPVAPAAAAQTDVCRDPACTLIGTRHLYCHSAAQTDERAAFEDAVTREQVEGWTKLAGIEHFTERGLERLGDFAIFARQATVKGDERASFPYQKTFNAIAAATKVEAGHIAISVADFCKAFGAAVPQASAPQDWMFREGCADEGLEIFGPLRGNMRKGITALPWGSERTPSKLSLSAGRAIVAAHNEAMAQAGAALTPEWLWSEFMDYCKEQGIAPANNNRLFEIVKRARANLSTETVDKPVQSDATDAARNGAFDDND